MNLTYYINLYSRAPILASNFPQYQDVLLQHFWFHMDRFDSHTGKTDEVDHLTRENLDHDFRSGHVDYKCLKTSDITRLESLGQFKLALGGHFDRNLQPTLHTDLYFKLKKMLVTRITA